MPKDHFSRINRTFLPNAITIQNQCKDSLHITGPHSYSFSPSYLGPKAVNSGYFHGSWPDPPHWLDYKGFKKGKRSFGGIPPGFTAIWGVGSKRARGTCSRGPEQTSNAIPKPCRDAPSPCQARTQVFFFSGTFLGLTGQRRTRGQTKPPF